MQSNKLVGLSRLHERVLRHLPLLNLGLGCNRLDLSEAIEMPSPNALAPAKTAVEVIKGDRAPFAVVAVATVAAAGPEESARWTKRERNILALGGGAPRTPLRAYTHTTVQYRVQRRAASSASRIAHPSRKQPSPRVPRTQPHVRNRPLQAPPRVRVRGADPRETRGP